MSDPKPRVSFKPEPDDETEDPFDKQKGAHLLCGDCGHITHCWVYLPAVGTVRVLHYRATCGDCGHDMKVPSSMNKRLMRAHVWPIRKRPPRKGKKKTEVVALAHWSDDVPNNKRARRL